MLYDFYCVEVIKFVCFTFSNILNEIKFVLYLATCVVSTWISKYLQAAKRIFQTVVSRQHPNMSDLTCGCLCTLQLKCKLYDLQHLWQSGQCPSRLVSQPQLDLFARMLVRGRKLCTQTQPVVVYQVPTKVTSVGTLVYNSRERTLYRI